MTQRKLRFFVDASPLAGDRSSGVGHSVYGFVLALTADSDFMSRYSLHLVAPFRGMKYVKQYGFVGANYVSIPLPARIWNRLPGTPVMPFMDLFLGKGVYFLTNFRSWPLAWSKSITLIHDITFRLFPESLTPRHRSFLEHQVALWKSRSTLIATVSESAKNDIHEHLNVDESRIVVLYNGVDTTKFYPRPQQEVDAVRTKYSLPNEYVLFVGNLEPRKNLGRLLSSYMALPSDLRNKYGLVIIGGSDWLADGLKSQIAQAQADGANIVRPSGYVTDDELPAIYTAARAFAWPALHEGFGMPLLEAMACNVPVLTARNSSLPEVAGDAAVLVNAKSEKDIGDGLVRVLTDETLRRKLVSAGKIRVTKFTWAASARSLVEVADRLSGREVVAA